MRTREHITDQDGVWEIQKEGKREVTRVLVQPTQRRTKKERLQTLEVVAQRAQDVIDKIDRLAQTQDFAVLRDAVVELLKNETKYDRAVNIVTEYEALRDELDPETAGSDPESPRSRR